MISRKVRIAAFLLRPLEQWRSIVMSTSVCVSVFVFVREDISINHARSLPNFSVCVAYGCGLVLLAGCPDKIPRGRGSFGGFLPH